MPISQPTTGSGLFPVIDPDRQAKGRQKMHGLALYINHVWEACTSTDTNLCRDHGLDVDSERVALEIAPALAAVRAIALRGPDDPSSRRLPNCLFIVMAAFCIGSFFFLRMLLRS